MSRRQDLPENVRRAIQRARGPIRKIAFQFNVNASTVQKWRSRTNTKSVIATSRTSPKIDEDVAEFIVSLRYQGLKIKEITGLLNSIIGDISTSSVARCLRRKGLVKKRLETPAYYNLTEKKAAVLLRRRVLEGRIPYQQFDDHSKSDQDDYDLDVTSAESSENSDW